MEHKIVYHKIYGKGIIEKVNNDILTIVFDNQEKTCKSFKASIAFDSVLSTEDEELKSWVKCKKDENNTCSICGKIKDNVKKHNEVLICDDCFQNVEKCERCGKYELKDTIWFSSTGYCKECFDRDYFVCSICGDVCLSEDYEVKSDIVPKNERWCIHCIEKCSHCKKTFRVDSLERFFLYDGDDIMLCQDCKTKYMKQCVKCGEIAYIPDLRNKKCGRCNELSDFKKYLTELDFDSLRKVEYVFGRMNDIQTRQLMSRLNHCSKDSQIDVLLISNLYNSAKWVVVSGQSELYNPFLYNNIYQELTMTELKRKNGFLFVSKLEQLDDDYLLKINKGKSKFYLWKKPILLKAQTYQDMDFRKEWNWGELVYEGNNFGDTSDFYIIGSIYSK